MQYFDVVSVLSKKDRQIVKDDPDDILSQMVSDIKDRIPKELGERIVKEFQDKNNSYQLGIARTRGNFVQDVFKNGYKIFGNNESSFGISYYDNGYNELFHILHQIVAAPYYKSSDKVYIFKIPKESINYYEEGKSLPILFPVQEQNELGFNAVRVLPEYILGYVPVSKENIGTLIENPNYRNKHNYLTDGLLYDSRVEYSKKNPFIKQTNVIPKENVFDKIWNKIKYRILNKYNKALPEGKEKTNYVQTDIKQREIGKYYVGEVTPSKEFIDKQQDKKNESRDEFFK